MESFKRSKFPLANHLISRQWRSETDIQSSLPPIQGNDRKKAKQINTSGKPLCPNRPGTPNPGRKNSETLFSWGKTSRLSSGSSPKRLSLSLDLRPVVEGACLRLNSAGFADNSPDVEWNPRPCVRSLPSSPTVQRSNRLHRTLRKLSDESEHADDKFKDDRILNWIRDVSEKTIRQNSYVDDDNDEVFDSSLETSTADDSGVIGLPVIQEGQKA